jgi:hypothetical protein
MKTYKNLVEDIGLSTGVGLTGIDIPLGTPPIKRKFNGYNNDIQLATKLKNVFESLGICEEHMEPKVLLNGNMVCKSCYSKK